ncbi:hypothetical protein FNF29_04618 [Cafeteria roenbergensis]|uniref:Uncharacterized protein n=1 Tax=Cafeteria roenbergensis TaxID=33653 RepID=A0A5A8CFB5_CAFRO|nr:hypothetical protein FNF29_04618 [Cafeteria roenbergensis]|eukprot:KAA0151419.1 hypothetical protein FNF29_04618 [Cafeteria roenbergensis]
MAAVKGLRSADNEDIVKLLGRLGTASMELAHSTDINAVLQHAGVTLAMPGGEALLAKWHRLGHLQSVAGGFAEVMAKPSTIATVETHAKKLLLEANREAKREAEEQAEKAKREAEERELRLAPAHTLASLLDSCLLVINGRQGKALLDVLILRVQAALVSRLPPDSPVMAGLPPEVVRLSRRLKQQSVDNACKLAKETGAAVPQEDLTPAGLQTVADCLINTLKSCHDLSWLASQPALFDILHCTATACPPVFLAEGGPTAKVAENLLVTQQYNMHGAAMRDGLLSMPEFGDAVAPSFPFRPYRHGFNSSSTVETSLEYVSLKSLLSAALSASQRLFGDDAAHTKELMKFESSFSSSSRSMQRLRADIEAAADFWHEVGFFRGRTLTSSFVMPGQAWRSFAVHLVLAGSSLTAVEMMALVSPASKILSDHFERLLAAELLHSGFQAFVSACMARFAPGRECSSRLMERLAATASTDSAAAELVNHRHVAKGGESLPSPPPLEPIMVWGGTSKDPKVVAADKDDEPIKPWQLLKHRHDWGGVDVMVVFAVKDCVYVLLLQSKAFEPSLSGAPKEMTAATAANLQTGMFNMATELRTAVVPSPEPRKAWSDIPGKRSLIARIMDNDIAKGCTEMVVCSSVITTKVIKETPQGCKADLFRIPESPETFVLEEGEPSATGSAAEKPRSVQVWDLRLPADSMVLRKLMTKDMEDALSVCGIELPSSAE